MRSKASVLALALLAKDHCEAYIQYHPYRYYNKKRGIFSYSSKANFQRTSTISVNRFSHSSILETEQHQDKYAKTDNCTSSQNLDLTSGKEIVGTPAGNVKSKYPSTPTLKECLSFALPALGIYACPTLMSLIDASFIGRGSSLELAALGPACSISDSSSLPLLFLSIGATNLVAKSTADGDEVGSVRVTRTTLGLGFVSGLFLALMLWKTSIPLSVLYCSVGQQSYAMAAASSSTAPLCATYVAIRAFALPAVVIANIAQAVCIGLKDTRTPMIAVALAGVLNLFGDFILVNGLRMGIAGAAWATALSQVAGAGLLLRVLQKRGLLGMGSNKRNIQDLDANGTEQNKDIYTTKGTILSLLSFIPFLFVMGVKIGMHNACSATAASLGGAPAAAHTALYSVGMLCFTFGDVGSSLSQAFLPAFSNQQQKDETEDMENKNKKKESFDLPAAISTIRQLLKCTFSISATVVAISSAFLTIFSGSFTRDPAVMQQMRAALPMMIATLSLHSTAVTLEGLLLARKSFRALTMTYMGVAVSIAVLLKLVQRLQLGLMGVWGVYVWFQVSRIISFSALGGLLALMWSNMKSVVSNKSNFTSRRSWIKKRV